MAIFAPIMALRFESRNKFNSFGGQALQDVLAIVGSKLSPPMANYKAEFITFYNTFISQ